MKNTNNPLFSSIPIKAADWALENYENSGYDYGINADLFSTNPTYCSKIVWQAYWFENDIGGGQWRPRFMDIPITKVPTPYGMPT